MMTDNFPKAVEDNKRQSHETQNLNQDFFFFITHIS